MVSTGLAFSLGSSWLPVIGPRAQEGGNSRSHGSPLQAGFVWMKSCLRENGRSTASPPMSWLVYVASHAVSAFGAAARTDRGWAAPNG